MRSRVRKRERNWNMMCISIRFVEIHCYINIIFISLAAYISEQIEQSFLFWRATRYLSRTFIDWFTNQFCYDVLAYRYWHTWKKYVKNIKLKHIVHFFLALTFLARHHHQSRTLFSVLLSTVRSVLFILVTLNRYIHKHFLNKQQIPVRQQWTIYFLGKQVWIKIAICSFDFMSLSKVCACLMRRTLLYNLGNRRFSSSS